jgi:hypothetical protein
MLWSEVGTRIPRFHTSHLAGTMVISAGVPRLGKTWNEMRRAPSGPSSVVYSASSAMQAGYIDAVFLHLPTLPLQSDDGPYIWNGDMLNQLRIQ